MENLKEAARRIRDIVPKLAWWPYAAFRLGVFVLAYLALLSMFVIGMTIAGVSVGFGVVIGAIPVAVFLAIRISGALTKKGD